MLDNIDVFNSYFKSSTFDVTEEDGLIHVTGNVRNKSIKTFQEFPVKFGKILGNFDCNLCGLTSLVGAPTRVMMGSFCVNNNQLTSLIGSPEEVDLWFSFNGNRVSNLEGGPKKVGSFSCCDNPLTSLQGLPEITGKLVITLSTDLPILRLVNVNFGIDFRGDLSRNLEIERIFENVYDIKPRRQAIIACQKALIDAGYEGNARL